MLQGIDLQVERGEVVVLIGPSGSGKTTVLRCLNLITPIEGGRIVVEGETIAEVAPGQPPLRLREADVNRIRGQIGMVFQHFNLFPHLRVIDNITLAPRLVRGMPRPQAEALALELLGKVGLREKAHSLPATLSGGQKQRVAIVRALAMHPKVMLFDEVTSALDPETVGEVLGVMKRLAREGMTMIVATHEMDFAREVADRVVFIDGGKVVEAGPPSAVLARPRHERTRLFLRRLLREDDGLAADNGGAEREYPHVTPLPARGEVS